MSFLLLSLSNVLILLHLGPGRIVVCCALPVILITYSCRSLWSSAAVPGLTRGKAAKELEHPSPKKKWHINEALETQLSLPLIRKGKVQTILKGACLQLKESQFKYAGGTAFLDCTTPQIRCMGGGVTCLTIPFNEECCSSLKTTFQA